MPVASQCQMSTVAPATGVHVLAPADSTRSLSMSGSPAFIEPSAGSERTSGRLRRSSTKYGPSVCCGVTMQDAASFAPAASTRRARKPTSSAAPVAPSTVSAMRRLMRRSTCRSSLAILTIGLPVPHEVARASFEPMADMRRRQKYDAIVVTRCGFGKPPSIRGKQWRTIGSEALRRAR